MEAPRLATAARPKSAKKAAQVRLALTHMVLIALSVTFVMPFLWMLTTSLKPLEETMRTPPTWVPSSFDWKNYSDAVMYNSDKLGYIPFLVYARNTIVLCILTVAGTVMSNALVAYSFARLRWPGRDFFFIVTISTMMIPFPVLMVPTYALFKNLDWIGTFRPLWVPAFFGSAFSIFLLRQFFRTIPFELSEAAKLDGASDWRIFLDVIVPLAKPALIVVGLFNLLATWNSLLGPLIYLMDQKTFTLSLGLQQYQSQHGGTQWNQLMAATVIFVLPIVVLFFFAQRQFIRGIAVTGLKG
jgi:multiple sugar transport system permease protein